MPRIVYVNGDYVPEDEAKVSVFDRGFLFADGVYEVTSVLEGKLIDYPGHVARLERSLSELGMGMPLSDEALLSVHRQMVARNDLEEGLVYLQVTRGAADRNFLYPPDGTPQTLVLFTQQKSIIKSETAEQGIRIISVPDIRWGRRDIKTVQLLPPSMCKMMAKAAGKDDAWMIENGFVTEGTSSNTYIVTKEQTIVTRNLSNSILPGITRNAVLQLAAEQRINVEERPFSIDEAKDASEAFITSATAFVCPVLEIDSTQIGDGSPGPIARRLRNIYIEASRAGAL